VIGIESSLLTSPVLVAEVREYFDEVDLDIELKKFDS
jgi:ABC-type nitrate/sulfonate/bicarbonate transport system substrate-binding protein